MSNGDARVNPQQSKSGFILFHIYCTFMRSQCNLQIMRVFEKLERIMLLGLEVTLYVAFYVGIATRPVGHALLYN